MTKRYRANAKLNLLLDVAGRRADGYHDVAMVLHSIDLCDIITVETTQTDTIELRCSNAWIPTDSRNIAWKAAAAFGITQGLRIAIEKNIPSQAGLGGGSADAAAVLTALRDLFAPEMPEETLRSIGATVGADVPFCLQGGCCLAQGLGELLTPLPCLPQTFEFEVLKPKLDVSTAQAYAALDAIEPMRPNTAKAIPLAAKGDWQAFFPLCANVFEDVIPLPGRAEYKRQCRERGALLAQMTGSGSALFSLWQAGSVPGNRKQPMPCEAQFRCKPAAQGVAPLAADNAAWGIEFLN